MRYLLDHGARIDAKDSKQRTALMHTARKGYLNEARLLLQRGALVNEKDAGGKTALALAKENLEDEAREEMLQVLKSAGAK